MSKRLDISQKNGKRAHENMPIKSTIRNHNVLTRMAKIEKTAQTNY